MVEREESASLDAGKYVVSKNSEVFNVPSCRWAKRISEENKVYLVACQKVVNSGRRFCRAYSPMDSEVHWFEIAKEIVF